MAKGPAVVIKGLSSFSHSLQVNGGVLPQIMSRPAISNIFFNFIIHETFLQFDTSILTVKTVTK
jgi:hypothetical protein